MEASPVVKAVELVAGPAVGANAGDGKWEWCGDRLAGGSDVEWTRGSE